MRTSSGDRPQTTTASELSALLHELWEHDRRGYGQWTQRMRDRVTTALGYGRMPRPVPDVDRTVPPRQVALVAAARAVGKPVADLDEEHRAIVDAVLSLSARR